MSEAIQTAMVPRLNVLSGFDGQKKLIALIMLAAGIALLASVWMWGKSADYKVLYSNVSDRDGGAIIGALAQMNVPYKFTDGGGAILVPAEQVHEARLKLAALGLPKGGTVGFELMENQKLGVSQFVEQVNYQRALEGELARSMQSLASVQNARVHIAFAKQSVFVRDQQKPSASVLLNLYPGRSLDPAQVSAIVHLVSSSIPDLPTKNITILDQSGQMLSKNNDGELDNQLDPGQLKYVEEYQQNIAKRIESILQPILGENNVRAEVTAEVDFSRVEQAAETYKPNQNATDGAIRSQQISEASNAGGASTGGVPGALSNQPPAPATAPINAAQGNTPAGSAGAGPTNTRKDATTNYEVDKTIRYSQQPMGGVKRVSAAVVVNYRKLIDKSGKASYKPLSAVEKTQIEALVKEAMGFSATRGDTLNVVNSQFTTPESEKLPDVPMWKQPENIEYAQSGIKYLLMGLVGFYVFAKIIRPAMNKLSSVAATAAESGGAAGNPMLANNAVALTHEDKLQNARLLARQDPKAVANVVKTWVAGNE
ncbi:MAG: flagellar basal-body MS-ring/collar protein FliF [Thiobacillaceae bacterium]